MRRTAIVEQMSPEYLRSLLTYNRETGVFRWRDDLPPKSGPRRNGKVAGTRIWSGYIHIKIDGVLILAHRLAWFFENGEWPKGWLDHIDEDKANNAICNLRIATPSQNAARRRTTRTVNASRGVTPHGAGFVARIHHGGGRHYLGYFPTLAAARAAYEEAAKELHGEFAHVETPSDLFIEAPKPSAWAPLLPSAALTGLSFCGMT